MPQAIGCSFIVLPTLKKCHLHIVFEHYGRNLGLKIGLFLENTECVGEFSMLFLGHIRGMIKALSLYLSRTAGCRHVHLVYLPFPPGVESSYPALRRLVMHQSLLEAT